MNVDEFKNKVLQISTNLKCTLMSSINRYAPNYGFYIFASINGTNYNLGFFAAKNNESTDDELGLILLDNYKFVMKNKYKKGTAKLETTKKIEMDGFIEIRTHFENALPVIEKLYNSLVYMSTL